MNGEDHEFPDKRKTNPVLKDNTDSFASNSGENSILSEGVCKYNKEKTREEHFYLLDQALKVLVIM